MFFGMRSKKIKIDSFLKKAKSMSNDNLNITIYSKSGAFE